MSKLASLRKLSEETKDKIYKSMMGELNPFWGKTHTAETLAPGRAAQAPRGYRGSPRG